MAHPVRWFRYALRATRPGVAMSDPVVAIVSAFFLIGITVGVVVVIALSALRPRPRRRGWPGRRLEYRPPDQPPERGWDEGTPDEYPRWPGDDDTDFGGR
jgi:hypothetical protein